ncbi:MAG TPA: DUF4082 domain-containing protein [Puia sp.]|nr:DUF4082 domain-containing protein [Puia sp.]
MEKIVDLLNTAKKQAGITLLCIFLLGISCKKETSSNTAPPPPPPPPPPVLDSVSIFGTQKPVGITENDSTTGGIFGIELGVKFHSSANANVVAVKFYKTKGNNGAHTAQLYTKDGTLLASQVYQTETDSGWQTLFLTVPVPINANTTYIAAYFSSLGNYVSTAYGLKTAVTNGVLTALADSADGLNGVYKYTNSPSIPDSSNKSNNYWVDVIVSH